MTLEEVAENHGLTPEGVNYALTQYQIVICEITQGMMSKLSYDAKDILRMAQKRWCDVCELKEPVEPDYNVNGTTCGNCGDLICRFDTYCSTCGRKIKW